MENEKKIINLIRFTPILFLVILSTAIIQIILYENKKNFNEEIKNIERVYLKNNKTRVQEEIQRVYIQLKLEKEKANDLLKQRIKNRVYQAHTIAMNIYKEESKLDEEGKVNSKEHISRTIKNALAGMIYNEGRGYIFIRDNKGRNFLQATNKKFENTNTDKLNNEQIDKEVSTTIKIINNKTETYLEYPWFKSENENNEYTKSSFIKYFEPLNLVIGSGDYIEDFENELKEKLLEKIRKIRFGKTGYVFIYNLEGLCLSHFKKEFIGVNRINVKDKNAKYVVKEVLDFAEKNKQGFMSYIATMKPNDKIRSREKISYVKLFKEWKWVIGTGFYLDSLNSQINEQKELLIELNEKAIKKVIIISLFITLLALMISFFISRVLEKRFLKYNLNLRKQKNRLLLSQEMAHVGTWQFDIKKQESYLSLIVLKMFGITEVKDNQFLKYLKKVIHPDDLEHTMKSFQNALENAEEYSSVYRIYRPNNEIRWINSKGSLNKDKTYMFGVSQDITELKELEQEKQQKDRLLIQQSKMATMGEMIGNITHQWKQPLSLISISNGLVKLNQVDDSFSTKEEIHDALENIDNSVQHLSNTIDDFRNFFRPDKEKTFFNLKDTFSKIYKLMNSQLKNESIQIIDNIDDIEAYGYKNELIQVLINIIKNAKDELIKLQADKKRLLFISIYVDNNDAIIKIKDNAGGIPEDVINKIFDVYFTTKEAEDGTGIGLYMSKQIIEGMHGIIKSSNVQYIYESKSYTGAEFEIKLPL